MSARGVVRWGDATGANDGKCGEMQTMTWHGMRAWMAGTATIGALAMAGCATSPASPDGDADLVAVAAAPAAVEALSYTADMHWENPVPPCDGTVVVCSGVGT